MAQTADHKILTAVSAGLAGTLARKLLAGVWQAVAGRPAPNDPEHPETELREAIVYAAISGALIALARLFAVRAVAALNARKSET